MRNLALSTISILSLSLLLSCATNRNSSTAGKTKKNRVTGLKPTTGRPSTAVLNASGDSFSPGINPHNRTTGSSKEQATAIANDAIRRATVAAENRTMRLDTLSGRELISRISSSTTRQMTITAKAQKEGESQKIKDYASMIMKDHQLFQEDLNKLSTDAGIKQEMLIVTRMQTTNASAQHRSTNEYIQLTIEDHRHMIRLLEAARRSINKKLSAFAEKHLPMLNRHLARAQDLTINNN